MLRPRCYLTHVQTNNLFSKNNISHKCRFAVLLYIDYCYFEKSNRISIYLRRQKRRKSARERFRLFGALGGVEMNDFYHFPGCVRRKWLFDERKRAFGVFCIFWRGLRHDFDLFWPISVKCLVYLGAFDGFRSAWVLGWSVMFGWLTVFVHGVFHWLLWGADWVLLCTVAGWVFHCCLRECLWVAVSFAY